MAEQVNYLTGKSDLQVGNNFLFTSHQNYPSCKSLILYEMLLRGE